MQGGRAADLLAVLIILLSFLPVFALGGLEGKMFHPLAFTKSFAVLGVGLLSITLVPARCTVLVEGRLRTEQEVGVVWSWRGRSSEVSGSPRGFAQESSSGCRWSSPDSRPNGGCRRGSASSSRLSTRAW